MKKIIFLVLAFLIGIITGSIINTSGFDTPNYADGFEMPSGGSSDINVRMPQDRVAEEQILVYRDRVILDIENAEWATFTPTKSMYPFLDTGANAIQMKPAPGCNDIEIGDIISYKSEYSDGTIIHRVVNKDMDKEGLYFKAKGDNNPDVDPGKIRCGQILKVLVGIIY